MREVAAALGAADGVGLLVWVDATSSTNDEARALGALGAPAGTVVAAGEQHAGRGRHGRRWHSAPGLGLYVSILFRPDGGLPQRWTIAAGIAACEALRATGIAGAEIDWPNDVTVAGRKIAGTLVEARSRGAERLDLVVGTGFNVDHVEGDFPAELRGTATSVRMLRPELRDVAAALAVRYVRRMIELAAVIPGPGWDDVRRRWEDLAPAARGRRVRIAGAGGPPEGGLTAGIDPGGTLLVRDACGRVRPVPAGATVLAAEA